MNHLQEFIRAYIEDQSDMRLTKKYCDNGLTGTNFERPGFKQLLSDVQAGKINCIVVKNLSRFDRNYTETGNYLQRIFPFLGVSSVFFVGEQFVDCFPVPLGPARGRKNALLLQTDGNLSQVFLR